MEERAWDQTCYLAEDSYWGGHCLLAEVNGELCPEGDCPLELAMSLLDLEYDCVRWMFGASRKWDDFLLFGEYAFCSLHEVTHEQKTVHD